MHDRNRKNSLYTQLIILLVVSAMISVLLFGIINKASEYVIDYYFVNNEYVVNKNNKYISEFQEFINNHGIYSTDSREINKWVKSKKIISIELYKDGMMIYNSESVDDKLMDIEIPEDVWKSYYELSFADGKVYTSIYGLYDYQLFNLSFVLSLIIAFITFIIIVICGIRKKINYIMKLSNEIGILEGGNLDYEITVDGKDELSYLAFGLDSMRRSFRNQVEQESRMVQENQRIITEMSHDLRTPITAMLLYTQIIKKQDKKGTNQTSIYLDKIESKANQMKNLTDSLFEYSLVSADSEIELEEPVYLENAFYDIFSESYSYLSQKGFQLRFDVAWMKRKVQINTDYVVRILDNINSNLIKYADLEHPIKISLVMEDGMVGFLFTNKIRKLDMKPESTSIGVQSIGNMMMKMKGSCRIDVQDDFYHMKLLFPMMIS